MEKIRYFRRRYNSKGIYQGYELHKPVITLGSKETKKGIPILVNKSPAMEVVPAIKEKTVSHKLVTKRNLIKNSNFIGGFEKETMPIGWGGTATARPYLLDIESNNWGLNIWGHTASNVADSLYVQPENILIESTNNVQVTFSFDYFIFKGRGWRIVAGEKAQIHIEIKVGNKYLDSEGFWMDTPATIAITDITTYRELTKFEITSDVLPEGGECSIKIFQLIVDNGRTDSGSLIIDNIKLYLLIDEKPPKDIQSLNRLNNPRYTIVPATTNILLADAPETVNAKILYSNVWYRQDGTLTQKWHRGRLLESLPILEIVLDSYIWIQAIPTQKLKLSIFSWWTKGTDSISFNSIIRDRWNYGRCFQVVSGSWDVKYSTWSVAVNELRTTLEPLPDIPGQPEQPGGCPERLLEQGSFRLLENGEVRLLECEPMLFGERLLEDYSTRLLEDGTPRLLEYHNYKIT